MYTGYRCMWDAAELYMLLIFLPAKKATFFPNPCIKGFKKRKNGDETWRWNVQEVPIISSILLFFAFDEWCLPHSKTKGYLQSVQILYFITHVYTFTFVFKNYGEKHFVKMLYRDIKLCVIIIDYFDAFFLEQRGWIYRSTTCKIAVDSVWGDLSQFILATIIIVCWNLFYNIYFSSWKGLVPSLQADDEYLPA